MQRPAGGGRREPGLAGRGGRRQLRGPHLRGAFGHPDVARGAALPAPRDHRPNFQKYRAVSQQVFEIFRSVTPLVEGLSLDEAYLDVTTNAWHEPLGMTVARRIKTLIHQTTGLTASAGVAPNKFLAKIASAWRKPDGLTVIAPERMESFLQQLPVDALWGVGPVTAARLRERGIDKLTDVRTADLAVLREAVGNHADWLLRLASGHDDRPVSPNRPAKSSSSECTYAEDLTDLARIRDEITEMAHEVAEWLVKRELMARTVTIKVRYDDFTTITRSHSAPATRDADSLVRRALALLDKTDAGRRPVRLLGAGVHNLVGQTNLDDDDERWPLFQRVER
jgi:DNA polymerase-4